KGRKDHVTMLPDALAPHVKEQLETAHSLFNQDRQQGRPGVYTHVLNRGGKGVRSPLDAGRGSRE
ncbi:MAG TPA: hypothetical protein VJL86_14030, partial [Steroidobacteraceae bacterium]|nr:hypothetical protein [Steroidobacteraceae bacterium]